MSSLREVSSSRRRPRTASRIRSLTRSGWSSLPPVSRKLRAAAASLNSSRVETIPFRHATHPNTKVDAPARRARSRSKKAAAARSLRSAVMAGTWTYRPAPPRGYGFADERTARPRRDPRRTDPRAGPGPDRRQRLRLVPPPKGPKARGSGRRVSRRTGRLPPRGRRGDGRLGERLDAHYL